MTTEGDHQGPESDLRRDAEDRLADSDSRQPPSAPAHDAAKLLHELRVHQIELEMQNEQLMQARDALESALARYTTLYDQAPVGYLTVDDGWTIRQANATCAEMLRIPRAKLKGRRLLSLAVGDDAQHLRGFLRRLFAVPTRETCELTLERSGTEPLAVRLEGVVAEAGDECLLAVIDISARRRAEREQERLQAELLQSQKMEVVGRLAGGVAHDFNNMLAVILGHTQLVLEEMDPTDAPFDSLQEVLKAAQRSADLTRQLLTFARKQTVDPQVISLNDHIAETLAMLRRLIGEEIILRFDATPGVWPVKIDPTQLDQILTNLITNARDAVSVGGSITIATRNMPYDATSRHFASGSEMGDCVVLEVRDNGTGMDADALEHVFEPFFTTKEVGQGVGLGLPTVYGIVKQAGGAIHVASARGQGTTFSIYLPRCAAPLSPAGPGGVAADRGHETVLVVEDEPALLALSRMILEASGYAVLSASTPSEALSLAESHDGPIHLLLSDVIMPEMNGQQLAHQVQTHRPTIKCLFMSGYTSGIIGDESIVGRGESFIQKPFSVAGLAHKVREVLDQD